MAIKFRNFHHIVWVQFGKSSIFLPHFTSNQILPILEFQKLPIATFSCPLNFDFKQVYISSLGWTFFVWIGIQTFQNCQNGIFWASNLFNNWFHVKSWRQINSEISTLCGGPFTKRIFVMKSYEMNFDSFKRWTKSLT